ncbi:hypothetical protein Tco_1153962 [Tanacetum coccineum]
MVPDLLCDKTRIYIYVKQVAEKAKEGSKGTMEWAKKKTKKGQRLILKKLGFEADEIISIKGNDIQKLTQDTQQIKDKVLFELQSRHKPGIENLESLMLKISNMQRVQEILEDLLQQVVNGSGAGKHEVK